MLGTVRANILHNNGTDIIRMSCVTVVAVFVVGDRLVLYYSKP